MVTLWHLAVAKNQYLKLILLWFLNLWINNWAILLKDHLKKLNGNVIRAIVILLVFATGQFTVQAALCVTVLMF